MKTAQDDATRQKEALIPVIEQLYLNYREADNAYRDLRDLAMGYLGQSDSQLNYFQKVYLHIRHANLLCRNQWELLAIINYIRAEALTDYFTLRVRDLRRAIFETETELKALDIYGPFIENPKVAALVGRAVEKIRIHVYLYEKLLDRCRPLARQEGPTPIPAASGG
ncbi:MAG: hypothetical protein JEZ11_06100 [Desulfobacterales bacterium]|nr:hypothetical protein [Desulfobacterales bacterium]